MTCFGLSHGRREEFFELGDKPQTVPNGRNQAHGHLKGNEGIVHEGLAVLARTESMALGVAKLAMFVASAVGAREFFWGLTDGGIEYLRACPGP